MPCLSIQLNTLQVTVDVILMYCFLDGPDKSGRAVLNRALFLVCQLVQLKCYFGPKIST